SAPDGMLAGDNLHATAPAEVAGQVGAGACGFRSWGRLRSGPGNGNWPAAGHSRGGCSAYPRWRPAGADRGAARGRGPGAGRRRGAVPRRGGVRDTGAPAAAGQRLVTRPPGSLLQVAPSELDLDRFEELAASAATLTAEGSAPSLQHAADLLAEAAALWRGP